MSSTAARQTTSSKDYYRVLGVTRDASPAGIRAAFRELAKRYHPDRAGPEGTLRFREVAEAYEVLSDERRRRSHDVELSGAAPASGRSRVPFGWRGQDRAGDVAFEVMLSLAEAARGGALSVDVPVVQACAACGGEPMCARGCFTCNGAGAVRATRQVRVTIPPGVRDGTTLEAPLQAFGIDGGLLRLRLCVGARR